MRGEKIWRAVWRGTRRCKFGNETAKRGKIQWHGNKVQCNEFSVASVCGRSGQSENGAVFGRGTSLSLSLSLSLVARTFWHTFGLNLKGFFTHFIVVFSHLFAYKRHFLGHFAFLKFLNALFLGFCALFVILSLCKKAKNLQRLKENLPFLDTSLALSMTASASLRAVFAKTADFVILSVAKNPKNLRYALFMDTSLTLSMTNSSFCLKITDIFTQNSKHFINLSQNLSLTQGFFISLSQIFAQFLLINLVERRSYGSSWHKRQDKNSRAD